MTTALLLSRISLNCSRSTTGFINRQFSGAATCFYATAAATTRPSSSILFTTQTTTNNNNSALVAHIDKRTHYTFNFPNNTIRYRRATRPRKSLNNSILLNYEQAQFAENIGVTKSWNSWNTSNLLEGKREAESARDDILIRKFIYGTFHDLLASEIIIKRRFNTINIGFLTRLPNQSFVQKVYFLTGYSEELLSSLLKCIVRIQPQTVYNKNDLVFRRW